MESKIIKEAELQEIDRKVVKVWDYLNTEEYPGLSVSKVKIVGKQMLGMDQESDTAYYVLEGEGQFIIEDKTHDVKKGDLVFIPHGTKYKDTAGLTLLAISTPRFERGKRTYFE